MKKAVQKILKSTPTTPGINTHLPARDQPKLMGFALCKSNTKTIGHISTDYPENRSASENSNNSWLIACLFVDLDWRYHTTLLI